MSVGRPLVEVEAAERLSIGRKEPDADPLELQRASHFPRFSELHLARAHAAEQPQQQIEKVNADVGDDTARVFLRALP